MESLLHNTRVQRVMNAVAAGTTSETSDVVDMQNYEGVLFVAEFGTLTADQTTALNAQQSPSSDSGFGDLAGTTTDPLDDDDDNKLLVLDIKNPQQRYVRCVVTRGTADAVIDGVIAIQYGPRKKPVAKHSTVAASKAVSGAAEAPAEGAA